jgi:glutathione peroxidase-family protein
MIRSAEALGRCISSFYNIQLKLANNEQKQLSSFIGKVLLITNVASK